MNLSPGLRLFFIRIFRYEFWPFWLFYLPMYFYGIFLALRSGSPTYFTAANPGMKYGGAFDMLKFDILQKMPEDFVPAGILIHARESENIIHQKIMDGGLLFPMVAKPNIGERGRAVELITGPEELRKYLAGREGDYILQEYIDLPLELGILYYKMPDGSKEEITSVMIRDFLRIQGDGISTVRELLYTNTRALFRKDYLHKRFESRMDEVLPRGEEILLEPIGNHNRGTCFLNASHLINARMLEVISGILSPVEGFDYGRLDLKTRSIECLLRGEELKVLELNGTNSEPAHIYDPGYGLIRAYRDLAKHMKIIYRISRINHRKGIPHAPFRAFALDLRKHLYPQKKRLE